MGVDVAKPLRLKRGAGRLFRLINLRSLEPKFSANALLGMGLWVLLWSGYNTDLGYVMGSEFPCQYHGFDPRRKGLFPDAPLVCLINDLRTIQPPGSLDRGIPLWG